MPLTTLVQHPWITTVAFVGIVVLGPLVGSWLVPRSRLTGALLAVAVVAVAVLTLTPTGRDLAVGCELEWILPTFRTVELMANVVLFAPVALLGGVMTRRPWAVALAASGASLLVEVLQAFATGLGRSCSTSDWVSNTLGALLGAVLAVVALRLARSRAASPQA